MARRSRSGSYKDKFGLLNDAIEIPISDDNDHQPVQPEQPAEPQKNPRRALFVLSYVLIVVRIQFTSLQPISN
jgi:hypothetical protein